MILNTIYYGLVGSIVLFLIYLGFKADFEIKKLAAKEALIEFHKEAK